MQREMIDIHADDYGYSLHTSSDILDCLKKGSLDSISIIGNSSAFSPSMELLYEAIPQLPFLPGLSIHLDLPEGECSGDVLPMSWGRLFLAGLGLDRKKVKKAVKEELKRQIELVQPAIDRCLAIADEHSIPHRQKAMRLDSHVHTHPLPLVWRCLEELIEEEGYAVEYIRNPKEPLLPFLKQPSLFKSYGLANLVKNRILMAFSGKIDRYCDEHGFRKMYMWGLMMSGHMDYERIEKILPDMARKAEEDGRVLEMLFHPGQALESECSSEKNAVFFRDFNSANGRQIEKDAVARLQELIRENDNGRK